VCAHCGRATVGEALGALYAGGKRAFAALAPTVFEACRGGDAVATDLVRKNALVIADLIRAAASPFGELPHDVILVGGLTHHADVLLPAVAGELHHDPRFCLQANGGAMVNGALYLAGLGKENPLC
jgi:N-acetylglucosamine kinase-like BadF-type ATPase